jgi:divalent metal cation (Fe/Co/Zn/Cd) transporter
VNERASTTASTLLRRGLALEYATLGWNVVGTVVVIVAALASGSVALAGFGLDSLLEIGASTVVIWQLNDTAERRERRALRLIGIALIALALCVTVQAAYTLVSATHPEQSNLGIAWTAVTCVVMLALAAGKDRTGRALGNRVLQAEARITVIDAGLAAAVLIGLAQTPHWAGGGRPTGRPRDRLLRAARSPRSAAPQRLMLRQRASRRRPA